MSRLKLTLVVVCIAATLPAFARTPRPPTAASGATEDRSYAPTLKSSNLIEAVKQRKSHGPALSPAGLARYANELLARGGFDYDFDVCELFPPEALPQPGGLRPDGTWTPITLEHRLTRADGRDLTFKLVTDDRGGMCTECFLTLAALRVTQGEMTVVAADGVTHRLKRPAAFELDEAHLVGSDLKTVLRTWQMPYQTNPAGVSPDGKSIYLDFYESSGLGELVLELSDDGRPRFRVRREVVSAEGEWIEEHPPDTLDDSPSFMRFRAGGRTHVIRFSGPCT